MRRVNAVEPEPESKKRKSATGEVKVSGLSHKRAKQSDPRLAWLMFAKICNMCRDVKRSEEKYREGLANQNNGLDLLSLVLSVT